MPDAAWSVSGHPPSSSRRTGQPPVLTSSNPLSTLLQRFACARLSQPCLSESSPTFPQRSRPLLLTTAACGGLRSAPDCRPRRTSLHLSYSYAAPFGPAILVTQDPNSDIDSDARPWPSGPKIICLGVVILHSKTSQGICPVSPFGQTSSYSTVNWRLSSEKLRE